VAEHNQSESTQGNARTPAPKKRHARRILGFLFVTMVIALIAARLAAPSWLQWYVNRTIDKDPLYDGTIGKVDLHLLRGGYTIHDIRLNKTTGNVPVPFFSASRIHLRTEWGALLSGKLVGRIAMEDPELNFVDGEEKAESQTGAGGPWLEMLADLFPFKINTVRISNGSIHFRAFESDPPVDVYLSKIEGEVNNLTNIHDEITPLVTTVEAKGLAMNQAEFEYKMKLDPFSYRPTFQMGVKLVGLDVTQVNDLSRAYAQFDFERGFFDLVVELDAKEGSLEGYVKPLFRNVRVLDIAKDAKEDNVLEFFWESLVGIGAEVLKNQSRDQVGTVIPLRGSLDGPDTDILATVGNVLRNAFVRAYLPRFEGVAEDVTHIEFGKPEPLDLRPEDVKSGQNKLAGDEK
jgi:hypothetical protein